MSAKESTPASAAPHRAGRSKRMARKILFWAALVVAVLYTAYPIVSVGTDAMGLNIAALFARNNVVIVAGIPYVNGLFRFTTVFYADALKFGAFPSRVINSLIIGGLSVGAALLVGIPAAYVLARVDIKGRKAISFVLLALRTVSPFAVVIPLYIVFTRTGLWNTFQGVALAELLLILTVVVWMVKGFFQDIPKEIYESASIFGASEGQIFRRVALPIAFQGIVITAIFGFILVWNEYLISVILTGPLTKTVAVGVFSGLGAANKTPDFTDLEAAATLAFVPAAVVILAIRKYLARGFSLATAR